LHGYPSLKALNEHLLHGEGYIRKEDCFYK
jgi:hypothetical protein